MTKQAYFTKIRRYRMKSEAIRLKGGTCVECGWSGNIAGFHFHHRDPSQKEFTISTAPKVCWEKYWKEVQKCDLICARCHAILHADNTDPQFLRDVETYNGRELVSSTISWKNQTHIPTIHKKNCPECGKDYETPRKSQKFCSEDCRDKNKRKCQRPSKTALLHMVKEMPMTHIGEKYGVTDNAVRKWCRQYQISL